MDGLVRRQSLREKKTGGKERQGRACQEDARGGEGRGGLGRGGREGSGGLSTRLPFGILSAFPLTLPFGVDTGLGFQAAAAAADDRRRSSSADCFARALSSSWKDQEQVQSRTGARTQRTGEDARSNTAPPPSVPSNDWGHWTTRAQYSNSFYSSGNGKRADYPVSSAIARIVSRTECKDG